MAFTAKGGGGGGHSPVILRMPVSQPSQLGKPSLSGVVHPSPPAAGWLILGASSFLLLSHTLPPLWLPVLWKVRSASAVKGDMHGEGCLLLPRPPPYPFTDIRPEAGYTFALCSIAHDIFNFNKSKLYIWKGCIFTLLHTMSTRPTNQICFYFKRKTYIHFYIIFFSICHEGWRFWAMLLAILSPLMQGCSWFKQILARKQFDFYILHEPIHSYICTRI